jgi:hypothetical protein
MGPVGFSGFVLIPGFLNDDRRTNYDVAQQRQPDLCRQISGKGKHVGGLVLVSILMIEPPTLLPVNEPNQQLCVTMLAQSGACPPFKLLTGRYRR